MRAVALLLLPAVLLAEEPEPGLVPIDIATGEDLEFVVKPGDAEAALKLILEAHEKHKKADVPAALRGYCEFMGNAGRLQLPRRYVDTVKSRIAAAHEKVKAEYEAALKRYERNRKEGLAALYVARGPNARAVTSKVEEAEQARKALYRYTRGAS